ncbi:MAG: hypothetical protein QM804_02920 [Propionicimonas sp.]
MGGNRTGVSGWARAVSVGLASVLAAGTALVGLGATTAAAAETTYTHPDGATVGYDTEARVGQPIHVSGTGWLAKPDMVDEGEEGSVIGFKLIDGELSQLNRSFELENPRLGTPVTNTTVWGAVQADSDGSFEIDLPWPDASNAVADPQWEAGDTFTLQLLSGTMYSDQPGADPSQRPDVSRTIPLTITVAGEPTDPEPEPTKAAPTITQQPQAAAAANGAQVSFTAKADGEPAPTVVWQRSTSLNATTPPATFTNLTAANTVDDSFAKQTLVVVAGQNSNTANRWYRAVFTNSEGSVTSEPVKLSIAPAPTVTTQPLGQTVETGGTATFAAAATSSIDLTMQWQSTRATLPNGEPDDATWANVAGATDDSLTVSGTDADVLDGTFYRLVFSNASGATPTRAAQLRFFSKLDTNAPVTVTGTTYGPAGATPREFSVRAPNAVVKGEDIVIEGFNYLAVDGKAGSVANALVDAEYSGDPRTLSTTRTVYNPQTGAVYSDKRGHNVVQAGGSDGNQGGQTIVTQDGPQIVHYPDWDPGYFRIVVPWPDETNTTQTAAFFAENWKAGTQHTVRFLTGTLFSPNGGDYQSGISVRFTVVDEPTAEPEEPEDPALLYTPVLSGGEPAGTLITPREVLIGEPITIAGKGWLVNDGSEGSGGPVFINQPSGGTGPVTVVGRTVENQIPGSSYSDARAHGVWKADADGDWSITIPFPTPANSSLTAETAWQVGQEQTVRILTGSLVSGDLPRTVSVPFTIVGGSEPTPVAPTVTTQPTDATVAEGGDASFTAAASGTPAPTVQWESSRDGSTWTPVTGATSPTLTVADVTVALSGTQYRAVFVNPAGRVESNPATLTVTAPTGASIALTRAEAEQYGDVWFNLTGFQPGTEVSVQLVNGAGEAVAAKPFTIGDDGNTANPDGQTYRKLTVPRSAAPGADYAVRVVRAAGDEVLATSGSLTVTTATTRVFNPGDHAGGAEDLLVQRGGTWTFHAVGFAPDGKLTATAEIAGETVTLTGLGQLSAAEQAWQLDANGDTLREPVFTRVQIPSEVEPGELAVTFSDGSKTVTRTVTIEAPTSASVTVDHSAELGGTIRVTGVGFTHPNGTEGSAIAIKIDDGAFSRVDASTHVNRTIWAVVEADEFGSFSIDLPVPNGTTADADGTLGSVPAMVPGEYTLRFLTGSLKPQDQSRTLKSEPFTVTAGEPEPEPELVAGTPTIAGSAVVGGRLTASAGTWGPAPVTFSYQWLADGVAIPGATAAGYTVAAANLGKQLSVAVTGSKDGYQSQTRESARTGRVAAGSAPVARVNPSISGTPTIGKTLTAKPGSWSVAGLTFRYQWLRNGVAIAGATKTSYVVASADAGKSLQVRVTASKPGLLDGTATSAAVKAGKALTKTPTPTISGTAKVGKTLKAKAGSWKPSKVTLAYQWLRDGQPIAKATKSSYKLTKADAGRKISVRVTGSKSGYVSVAKTSKAKSVAKVKATVKLSVPSKVAKGKQATAKLTVSGAVANPTGKVTVTVNGKKVTGVLTAAGKGRIAVKLPAIGKKGSYQVKASFTPTGDTASSTTKSSTVSKKLKVR